MFCTNMEDAWFWSFCTCSWFTFQLHTKQVSFSFRTWERAENRQRFFWVFIALFFHFFFFFCYEQLLVRPPRFDWHNNHSSIALYLFIYLIFFHSIFYIYRKWPTVGTLIVSILHALFVGKLNHKSLCIWNLI